MSAETPEQKAAREANFVQRMRREGSLDLLLREHVWNDHPWLRLDGEIFEPVSGEEVPGYEDEEYAVLLRRKSDGRIFLADIDVTMSPVSTPAEVTA